MTITLRCIKDIVSDQGRVLFRAGNDYVFQELLWQICVTDDLFQTHEIRGNWDKSVIDDHFEDAPVTEIV